MLTRDASLVEFALRAGAPLEVVDHTAEILGVDLLKQSRPFRRRFTREGARRWGSHYFEHYPVAGGATIIASRSGLFWRQTPGGLPIVQDHKVHTGNVLFVDSGTLVGGTTSGSVSYTHLTLPTIYSV